MSYTRFAIYYLPPEGALADFSAGWLGWDVTAGRPVDQPDVPGIAQITKTPSKYGFHGTLKPPFRLVQGCDLPRLADAVAGMAAASAPAQCEGLVLSRIGHFLALTPKGEADSIGRVAATCVQELDTFRAPMDDSELKRRRKSGLSQRQDALLERWGYPFVLDEFRFHLTLTGRLPEAEVDRWMIRTRTHLPALPTPFLLNEVALVGERTDGFFELIQRYTMSG